MKNIAISGTWVFAIPGGNIATTIVDVDRACLWIASERLNADADTEISIYKKGLPGDSYEMEDVSPPLKGLSDTDSPPPQVAPTELVAKLVSCTSRLVPDSSSQVVSLKSVVGEESLVVVMRGGDISSMKLGDPDPQACTLISHVDMLIHSSLSLKPLALSKMEYRRPHGVQMIRFSSLLRVSLL
jgi:elongator complex protein 1